MAGAGWLALSSKVGLLCIVPPADRSQATAACNERCESRCRLTTPRAQLLRQSVLLACDVCSDACCVAHRGAETKQNHNGALTLVMPSVLSVFAAPGERQDRKGVWWKAKSTSPTWWAPPRRAVTIAPCQVGRSGKPQHPFDRRPSSDCNVHRALAAAAGERTAVACGCRRTGAETPRCVPVAAS